MKSNHILVVPLIVVAGFVAGCRGTGTEQSADDNQATAWFSPGVQVPPGTALSVRLTSTISSETAHAGDAWTGVVTAPVIVDDKVVIPVGSAVTGMVAGAREAERGSRAMLELAVEHVEADGKQHDVDAASEPVVAGSPRARNLGAIAGGVAAGALIGKAVGGDGKDAAIGGVIGGAAATGAVAGSKGYQVVLKSGTTMTFNTTKKVSIKV